MAVEMNKLVLGWHCNAAQMTEFGDGKLFEFHMLKAEEVFNDIGKHYLPWYPHWKNTEANRLLNLWKGFKEEEKDPGFVEWREQIMEQMDEEAAEIEREAQQLKEAQVRRDLHMQEQLARQARRLARARLR